MKLSNKALDKLLAAGHGVEAALSIIRQVNVSNRQVGSVQALADVLSEEWAATVAVWTDLVIHFASPAGVALVAAPPSAAELLSFLLQAETGSDTMSQITALGAPASPYASLSDILPLVVSGRVSTLLSTNDDLATLHALLAGRDGGGTTTQRFELLDDAVTLYDCWRIAKAGRVGVERSASVGVVNELNEEGKHYGTVDQLVSAVAERSAQKQPPRAIVAAVVKPVRG